MASEAGKYGPFRPIAAMLLLLELIKKHYVALGVLAVFLHFIAWRLISDVAFSVPAYINSMFEMGWEVSRNVSPDPLYASLLYFVLLHVGVTTLTIDLPKHRGALGDSEGVVQRGLEGARAMEFFFDSLRSLGVLLATLVPVAIAITIGVMVMGGISALLGLESEDVPEWLGLVFLILPFLLASFVLTRFSLAIPITTIENLRVLASMDKSWAMTGSGVWMRLNVACMPMYLLFGGWLYLRISVFPALDGLGNILSWLLLTIITIAISAILVLCYESLRPVDDSRAS